MLGTAKEEKKDGHAEVDYMYVHFFEGAAMPTWKTEFKDLEAKDIWDKSAARLFQKSARLGDIGTLRHLVKDSLVNPNLRSAKGWTALLRAAKSNSLETVDWLCNSKADVNTMNDTMNSPLMKATKYCHADVVAVLVHHKADCNLKNRGGATALMHAAQVEEETPAAERIVLKLLEGKADINHKKPDVAYTALMLAARHGNSAIAELLIERAADIEAKDIQGETPLAKALKYENTEAAGVLSRAGAKPVTVTVVKRLSSSGKDSARMGPSDARRGRSREKGARRSDSAARSSSAKARSGSRRASGSRPA